MADKPALQYRAALRATTDLVRHDDGTEWFAEKQRELAEMCRECGYTEFADVLQEAATRRRQPS